MSDVPVIAQYSPFRVDVKEGDTHFYCACGQSKNQPFCDGSHKGTSFAPIKYEASETKAVFFCGCKQSGNAPLCDGTHSKLPK